MSHSGSATDVLIRRAVTFESSSIVSVLREAFAEYESLYTPDAFAATTPTADQIRERWSEGPDWVAAIRDNNVGTVSGVAKDEGPHELFGTLLFTMVKHLDPANRTVWDE